MLRPYSWLDTTVKLTNGLAREKREKSFECFLDELKRCEQLGLELYNFQCVCLCFLPPFAHRLYSSPGSTVGAGTLEESVGHIASCINRAHKETDNVVVVIENMVRPSPISALVCGAEN